MGIHVRTYTPPIIKLFHKFTFQRKGYESVAMLSKGNNKESHRKRLTNLNHHTKVITYKFVWCSNNEEEEIHEYMVVQTTQ